LEQFIEGGKNVVMVSMYMAESLIVSLYLLASQHFRIRKIHQREEIVDDLNRALNQEKNPQNVLRPLKLLSLNGAGMVLMPITSALFYQLIHSSFEAFVSLLGNALTTFMMLSTFLHVSMIAATASLMLKQINNTIKVSTDIF